MIIGYFKPLRRKLGVLTLGLACVFAGGWVRSLRTGDVVALARDKMSLSVRSESGTIKCVVRRHFGETPPKMLWNDSTAWNSFEVVASTPTTSNEKTIVRKNPFSKHKFELLGFITTSGSLDWVGPNEAKAVIQAYSLAFPDSYIVIPLTLLSAWLLLSKPRQRQTPIESVTDKAA